MFPPFIRSSVQSAILAAPLALLIFGGIYCTYRFSDDSKSAQEYLSFFLLIAGIVLLILRTIIETQRLINECVGQRAIGSETRTFWALGVGLFMGGVLMAAFLNRGAFEHMEILPAMCFLVTNGTFAVIVRLRRMTAAHEFHGIVVEVACLCSAIGYLLAKYVFHLVNGEFGLGLSFNAVIVQGFLFAFDEHFGQGKINTHVPSFTIYDAAPDNAASENSSPKPKRKRPTIS
jgi:hypothetical protein